MKKKVKFIIGKTKYILALAIFFLVVTGGAYAAIVIQGTDVVYSDTNVQAAIDALYQKKQLAATTESPIPETALKLGDYFTLVPDASTYTVKKATTGYTSDRTITPNELILWRVINIHSNGEVEAVSEYVSSTIVYFNKTNGYANFVGGLQTIAAQYAKTGYTTSTRMMGYGGQTATISVTSLFNGSYTTAQSTTSTPTPESGTGQEYAKNSPGDLGDTLYLRDYQLVSNVYKSDTTTYGTTGLKAYRVGTTTATSYWLASRRYIYNSSTLFYFCGRYVHSSGDLYNCSPIYYNSGLRTDASCAYSLRPIITLKSGVTLSGGSGSKTSPYTLS